MAATNGKSVLKQNTGKDFEDMMQLIFEAYERQGIATVKKVDPPTRVVGGKGQRPKVILLANPWLDYCGTWTEMGGRMLVLEAKSTDDDRLYFGDGGLTDNQRTHLRTWNRAGAVAAVLWHHQGVVKVVTWKTIEVALTMNLKSLKWQHIPGCPKGMGYVIWDILSVLHSTK